MTIIIAGSRGMPACIKKWVTFTAMNLNKLFSWLRNQPDYDLVSHKVEGAGVFRQHTLNGTILQKEMACTREGTTIKRLDSFTPVRNVNH